MSGMLQEKENTLSSALGAACALAATALLGRFAVLVAWESVAAGRAVPGLGARLSASAPSAFALALAAIVLLGLALRGRTSGRVVAAAAALFAVAISAGVGGEPFLQPEPGRAGTWVALGLVGVAVFGLGRRWTATGCRAVPGLVALAVVSTIWTWTAAQFATEFRVTRVVRELLSPDAVSVVQAHPEYPPRTDQICPSMDFKVEGMDMPALVLPPPADVAFTVRPEDGDVVFRARAGVDLSVVRWLVDTLERVHFDFEVQVNEETVFAETITLDRADDPPGSAWVRVGGERGVPLEPGDQVTLSTRVRRPGGESETPPTALWAGFCEMLLERSKPVTGAVATPAHPNVVLVVIDTLRADRLTPYGYARPTSPHLERLAERGRVFEEAYATSSWTWPSTASILTGLQPQQHGVTGATSCFLAHELTSLPEALQEAGYRAAAWSGNPLISPLRGYGQGFDPLVVDEAGFRKSALFEEEAFDWLDEHAGERFFLYLHLTDPHHPLVPSAEARRELAGDVPEDFSTRTFEEFDQALRDGRGHTDAGERVTERVAPLADQQHLSDLYDACVRTADETLGRLLDRLEALGVEEDTIVVVTADHGEELFDHGLLAHGHTLYGELVRVPLVIAGPGVPAGRVRTPVSNRHLAPSLAARLGVELAEVPDAVDLFGSRLPEELVVFSTHQGWWNGETPVTLLGMRAGTRTLHYAAEGRAWGSDEEGSDPLRLFDVVLDPGELRDLEGVEPDEAGRLLGVLRRRVEALEASRRVQSIPAGALTVDLLRRLGYLESESE